MTECADLDEWADTYIDAQTRGGVDADDPAWWAIERFFNLLDGAYDAEPCWLAILTILARNPPKQVLEILSAGSLEDLIDVHGPRFVDRIEAEGRTNPEFRKLLLGVWESSTPDIWTRIENARGPA